MVCRAAGGFVPMGLSVCIGCRKPTMWYLAASQWWPDRPCALDREPSSTRMLVLTPFVQLIAPIRLIQFRVGRNDYLHPLKLD